MLMGIDVVDHVILADARYCSMREKGLLLSVAKTAYFDCFSGASGDMVLGALLDLGPPARGAARRAGQPGHRVRRRLPPSACCARASRRRKFRANAEERLGHAGQVPSAAHRDAASHEHHAHSPGSHVHAPDTSHDHGHHHAAITSTEVAGTRMKQCTPTIA